MNYTEEMDAQITKAVEDAGGLATRELISDLSEEMDVPARSISYRMKNVLNLDVESTARTPSFSADETDAFLELADGTMTAEAIAEEMGKTVQQVRGKALSSKVTLLPSEKKAATPKSYSEDEEVQITALVDAGEFLEVIAEKLGRTVNSMRGKLLSMKLKAVQRDHKAAKVLTYTAEVVADLITRVAAGESLDTIVDATGLNVRGLKSKLGKMAKAGQIEALPDGFAATNKPVFTYTDALIEEITDFVGDAEKTSAETAEQFNIPLASLRSKLGRLGVKFAVPEKAAESAA